ncbi:MAG: hypothetical protein JRJ57_04465 [Deltaproteobacteria bacterium]|nr:hypothetical protein [Deltaproteobacteria bacterium]
MENDIFFLVNTLKDNNYEKKVDEEFDKRVSDMLQTDIDVDGSIEYSGNPFYVEINGHSAPDEFENFLLAQLNQFKSIAAEKKLDENKLLQAELSKQLFSIRTNLTQVKKHSVGLKYKNFYPLIDKKIDYCERALAFLSNLKTEILKLRKTESGKFTGLTQKQIVVLFFHLQKLGYVGKGIDKDDYAKLISEMTGFSFKQIRMGLSHIEKNSTSLDKYKFSETDYTVTKKEVRKVLSAIDKESL